MVVAGVGGRWLWQVALTGGMCLVFLSIETSLLYNKSRDNGRLV